MTQAPALAAAVAWLAAPPAYLGPNSAWTVDSSKPWERAKSARVVTSGRAALLVITFMDLPKGTTCRPAVALGEPLRACCWSLNICPFRTCEKSLAGAWGSAFLAADGFWPVLGEIGVGSTGFSFASMGSPFLKRPRAAATPEYKAWRGQMGCW